MTRWTNDEIDYLKGKYKTEHKDYIVAKLNRDWAAIKSKASSLSLKRVDNNLSILLENNNLTYYWIGFLLADGHFTKNELKLKLSSVDRQHLIKFANYIQCKNIRDVEKDGHTYISISASDCQIIPKIKEIFQIQSRKTYNPPIIEDYHLTDDALLSLIVGYIDGDGSVKRQGTLDAQKNTSYIKISCHESWLSNLDFFEKSVYRILLDAPSRKSAVSKNEVAFLRIFNHVLLKRLKEKAIHLNLPILDRKWDNIDLQFVAVAPKKVRINGILYKSIKEAGKQLNVAPITISRWVKAVKAVYE